MKLLALASVACFIAGSITGKWHFSAAGACFMLAWSLGRRKKEEQ